MKQNSEIELLAPAKDKNTAFAAINAGADAIYTGYSKFGARKAAGNSLEDIKEIVDYADQFRVNVYVTLNTIYKDEEIEEVISIIYKLYNIGVSAIIIQDMGILEYKLPPIRIFASTQCHNDSLEKIKFLEQTGFERVILPREFSLEEIKNITEKTNIEVETFIHGALCVSYSGQCYLSYINGGRSANRGECAQPCRKKYSIISNDGKIIEKDKYLLSLKDLNLAERIEDLILAGVTSFKIEGRLKDIEYVTNVVSFYRQKIDIILKKHNLKKSSIGKSIPKFEPNLEKSFNRGFTEFNIDGKRKNICTKNYVKSIGEFIGTVKENNNKYFKIEGKTLNNGDGICFFKENQELTGTLVQKNDNGKIYPKDIKGIKKNIKIYRNFDILYEKELLKPIKRIIPITAEFTINSKKITLSLKDEENNMAVYSQNGPFEIAENIKKANDTIKKQISKTGNTVFEITNINIKSDRTFFIPASILNDIRRKTINELKTVRSKNNWKKIRKSEINTINYITDTIDYRANILNQNAEKFYKKRGVTKTETAIENGNNTQPQIIMTSKHCIKYSLGLCNKYFKNIKEYKEPLFLTDEKRKKYKLEFDCKNCKMNIKSTKND